MSIESDIKDVLSAEDSDINKLPNLLNVVSIISYVGIAFAVIGGIYNFFMICKSAEMYANMDSDSMGSGFLRNMMDTAMTLAVKQCENKTIIFLITLICTGLCLLGVILMRKLKKSGFVLYAAGEFLFPIANYFIVGASSLSIMMMLSTFVIPIVFVSLYASQLKHLKQ